VSPHAVFANGGGPDGSHPELVALQSALDFESKLQQQLHWFNHSQYVKSIVNNQDHGRALRSDMCNDDSTGTVWYETSEFLYGVTT